MRKPDIRIEVRRMGDGKWDGWECEVFVSGKDCGGGTGPTASSALSVAMDILYGDTDDHLNGDYGALSRLEGAE